MYANLAVRFFSPSTSNMDFWRAASRDVCVVKMKLGASVHPVNLIICQSHKLEVKHRPFMRLQEA